MTSAEDFTLTFHIGAHKTATTHLQRSLEHAADDLVDAGVRYYGPDYFRLPGRTINRLFSLKPRFAKENRRSAADQLALMRKGANRLLFSEENYAGALNVSRPGQVIDRYPDAGARIEKLVAATGLPGIDLCLAIRHPATFLNSAYGQHLLGGRVVSSADYLAAHPLEGVDWSDLVVQLSAVRTVRRITVWRYEDYRPLFRDICTALVGAAAADFITPFGRRSHAGLSFDAVTAVHAAYDGRNGDGLAGRYRAKYPIGDAHPAFDHFDAATHDRVTLAYADQCAQIASLPKVRFLRPTV
ncbi:hypothetical protein [Yoonia sp. 2307UL14-13]|uniref:hypothetical protein n=1 Tax=Yoonia sp. 2307UL14-13 TaxID=3126506 RepID=UPI0030A0D113